MDRHKRMSIMTVTVVLKMVYSEACVSVVGCIMSPLTMSELIHSMISSISMSEISEMRESFIMIVANFIVVG